MLLIWGPVVATRVVLAVAHALDQGWLEGARWSIALDEPLDIGDRALLSAVEFVCAVAAIWAPTIIPKEVVARCNDHQVRIDISSDGQFLLAPEDQSTAPDIPDTVRDVHIRIEPFAGPLHTLPAPSGRQIVVRSTLLPFPLADARATGSTRARTVGEHAIPRWALVRALQYIFAKSDFLPEGPHPRGQEIAIRRVLSGQDSVVLLPTGAGKSLIYQLAGLLTPGLTLVVDPLVALIEDQLYGLERQGIDRAVGITSRDSRSGDADLKLSRIRQGDAYFVFVAPERLQQRRFRESLQTISSVTPISLAVVDESHCVSEWGHDFRTAYLDIGRVLRLVGADQDGLSPPLLALTGTASRAVLKDMLIELDVDRSDPHVIVSPQTFNRPELKFVVVRARNDEAMAKVAGTIQGLPARYTSLPVPRAAHDFLRPRGQFSNSGIVFCPTVNGRYGMQTVTRALQESLRIRVLTYAGKSPKDFVGDYEKVKRENAARFKSNADTVLVATKSFGMGIDKPNVRFVVHAGIPGSIEGYYQEAGRAGRDGREAVCVIVHFPDARNTQDFFHAKTFSGIEHEVKVLTDVMMSLMPLHPDLEAKVPFDSTDEGKVAQERALHRLRLLGIVEDFTSNWSKSAYEVRVKNAQSADVDRGLVEYVRRNQPGRVADFERQLSDVPTSTLLERVTFCGRLLIEYVYDTIVTARVRALDEMTRLADEGTSDEIIRDRILRYLTLSRVAESIEALLDRETFAFVPWCSLLGGIESQEDARDWRGATARLLEADPDNPGLLLGRGVAEAVFIGGNERLFAISIRDAYRSAATRYSVSQADLTHLTDWLVSWLDPRMPRWKALVHLAVQDALQSGAATTLGRMETGELMHDNPDLGTLAVILERRLFSLKHHLNSSLGLNGENA